MYRLFVAIDPPDVIRRELAAICYGLTGAKWVDESQMHITLKFVGEVDGAVLREAAETLVHVAAEPFKLRIKGLGFFPPRGDPKLLWAGIGESEQLVQLRNKVEATLVRTGLESERRKFAPHVRLANVKNTPPVKIASFLTELALFKLSPFEVREFHLYSSYLSSQQALHQVEATYPLIPNRKEES